MDAYRGELTSHHPHFHPGSPAAAKDIDLVTAKQLLPNSLTAGIHMFVFLFLSSLFPNLTRSTRRRGTWSRPEEAHATRKPVKEDIKYSKEDLQAIDDWTADHVEVSSTSPLCLNLD